MIITATERRSLKRIVFLLNVDVPAFALSVLLGVGALGAAIALSATSAWLIARASQHPPVLYLTVAATSVRLFGVSRAVLRYLGRLASHRVAIGGMDSLRQNLYRALAARRIDRITMLRRGDVLARTGVDVDEVGNLVIKTLLPVLVAAIVGVGTVAGLAFISPAAALIVGACLLVSGVVAPLISIRSARIAELDTIEAKTELAAGTLALMEGATELQVSGRIHELRARIADTESALTSASHRSARMAALAFGIDRFAMGASVVAALLIGIPQTSAGAVAAVALSVLVLTPLASFEGTTELAPAAVQLVRSATAAARIDELLGEEESHSTHPIPEPSPAPRITADRLSVGWPGGPILVEDVSLEVEPGHSIVIVGPSGIGKTTLALTLAGMLAPRAGTATLNGAPTWEADRADVTRHVTITAEDAHIFATSVLENLKVSRPDLDRGEAEHLVSAVGLGSWLAALPQGIDTLIGSGGTTVSGGERRRLLIARALAAPAPLLIVDEAGEHLDSSTADSLVRSLLTDPERGVVLISHRLSALDAADEVIVLGRSDESQPARIEARGTHEHLLATSEHYRWALAQEDE